MKTIGETHTGANKPSSFCRKLDGPTASVHWNKVHLTAMI